MSKIKGNPYYSNREAKSLMRKSFELVRLAYDDKIDEIQEFIDTHRGVCRKLQRLETKILLISLLRKQFKAYAVLKANGFQLPDENEGKTRRFEKLTEKELIELQNQVRKHFILPDVYLELHTNLSSLVKKLMQKTRMAANLYYMRLFDKLRKRYEELEAMEEIRPILVIIAASERLEIVGEFFEFYVAFTLPGMSFAGGICDFNTHIILLISSAMHTEALAMTVHEFIHYLMILLYDNRGLPFAKNDLERKAAYSKAYKACEIESKSITYRGLLQLEIFSYTQENLSPELLEEKKRAEGIVLPPCIPLQYREETVMRYKQCLAPLFDFYKKYTFPDIIRKSQEIEAAMEEKGK